MVKKSFSIPLVLVLLLTPIQLFAQTDNGYFIVHTRVVEDNISLTESEELESSEGNITKINLSFDIWNPTEDDIFLQFEPGFPIFIFYMGESYHLLMNYNVPDRYKFGDDNNMRVKPGLTSFSFERQSFADEWFNGVPHNGNNTINIRPESVHGISDDIISLNNSILLEDFETVAVSYPELSTNWGGVDVQYDKLMLAITEFNFRYVPISNFAEFTIQFQGEYWNPRNRTLYTGSAADCGDRLLVEKEFSIESNMYFLSGIPGCFDVGTSYTLLPGAHIWDENQASFFIYNLNNTTLPNGIYTFYFHVHQHLDNIHYAYLTAENGVYSYSFDDYPEEWGEFNTLSDNNPSSEVSYIFSTLLLMIVLSPFVRRTIRDG